MYQCHVDALEGAAKRKFLQEAEDVQALRKLDQDSFGKESDLGTGGPR